VPNELYDEKIKAKEKELLDLTDEKKTSPSASSLKKITQIETMIKVLREEQKDSQQVNVEEVSTFLKDRLVGLF